LISADVARAARATITIGQPPVLLAVFNIAARLLGVRSSQQCISKAAAVLVQRDQAEVNMPGARRSRTLSLSLCDDFFHGPAALSASHPRGEQASVDRHAARIGGYAKPVVDSRA